MLGISDKGPLVTDRNISIDSSKCKRENKCIVNHWNAIYSLWCYSHTWTVLFFAVVEIIVAQTSSE